VEENGTDGGFPADAASRPEANHVVSRQIALDAPPSRDHNSRAKCFTRDREGHCNERRPRYRCEQASAGRYRALNRQEQSELDDPRSYLEAIGGDYVTVQVAALDNVDLVELVAAPVRFSDGRDNNWQSPPAVTDYL
jgi:hypothetical protein